MAATLHIGLLGDFHLTYEGEPVTTVRTERLQALLAYLALHRGKVQARRHVAFSFWPDSTEGQAFNNLRNLLYRLRRALPEADRFLKIDATSLCWRAGAPFTLEVADFEGLLAQVREALQRGDSTAAQSALEKAVGLYRGDLLSGLYADGILKQPADANNVAEVRLNMQLTTAASPYEWVNLLQLWGSGSVNLETGQIRVSVYAA